jgi:hypothetical protein
VTAVLAVLMATDRNGDVLVRAVIGVAALATFIYAVVRLRRRDPHATDTTIGLPAGVRRWLRGESPKLKP